MSNRSGEGQQTLRTRLTNSHGVPITLIVEPWGDEHELPPASAIDLVARGPAGGVLEVDSAADRLTVFLWPGSTVALFLDGTEIGRGNGERPKVPDTPSGMSVRGFLDLMLTPHNKIDS